MTPAEHRHKQCHSAPAPVIHGGCLGTKQTQSLSSPRALLGPRISKGGSTDRRPEEARLQPAVAGKGRETSAATAGPMEQRETPGLIRENMGGQETPACTALGGAGLRHGHFTGWKQVRREPWADPVPLLPALRASQVHRVLTRKTVCVEVGEYSEHGCT